MGYSASTSDVSGPIIVKADRVEALFADLIGRPPDSFVANGGPGRWSWTDNFVDYEQTAAGAAKLFTDYGFYAEVDEDGDVALRDWGGDKLGSSAGEVWETLAKYAAGDVRWLFVGEDGEMWADCIEAGRHVVRAVTITVEEG